MVLSCVVFSLLAENRDFYTQPVFNGPVRTTLCQNSVTSFRFFVSFGFTSWDGLMATLLLYPDQPKVQTTTCCTNRTRSQAVARIADRTAS